MTSDFAEFYYGSYRRLFRAVVLLCASETEAEDVLNEAYSRAWARWDRVRTLDQPESWVRRVALNEAVDLHRGRSRDRRAWPRLVSRQTAPAADVSERPDVVRALEQLNPDQRRVVVLHYLVDRSVDDIARDLELPVGTVKSHLSRGRARLAVLLRVEEEVLSDER